MGKKKSRFISYTKLVPTRHVQTYRAAISKRRSKVLQNALNVEQSLTLPMAVRKPIGRQIRRPVFLDRKPEGRKIRRRNIRIRKCGVDPPSGTNTHEAVTLWPLGASTRTSDPCCGVQTLPMLGQSATQDATTAWLHFIQIETVIKWYKQNPSLRCRDTVSEKLWAISSPRIHKHC